MAQALAFEKVDEHGNPIKCSSVHTSRNPRKTKKPCIDTGATVTPALSDEDDRNFESPKSSESESKSGSDSDGVLPSNAEVRHAVIIFHEHDVLFIPGH
jgi:hypothetical protein